MNLARDIATHVINNKIDNIDEFSDNDDDNLIINNDSDDFLDKLNTFDKGVQKEAKQVKQKRRKNIR